MATSTLCVLLLLAGCGGGSGSSSGGTSTTTAPAITSVSVSCALNTVPVGQTNQCSATVQGTGSFNSAVNWSVSNVQGGNATVGIVASSGLYTAPAAVPTPYTVTVSATSAQDATKSASASVIVAGTIASVSQTITASAGGTITLPDGSSVTIAPDALPSDSDVTLSEVSYLENQPPNPATTSVGPGLVLTFSHPIQFTTRRGTAQKRNAMGTSSKPSSVPTAFHFVINTASNGVTGLVGSVPVVDFVDSLNNNFFLGAVGQFTSDAETVTADIGFGTACGATAVKFLAVSAFNFVEGFFHRVTVPNQLVLSDGTWTNYSSCPSGKTLVVVHGMNSTVEGAFPTTSPNQTIQNIQRDGGYDSVVGFDYDWTQAIDASGAQLASFLTTLSQCSQVDLDIEAHSEGVPVSMSALTKSSAQVKHLVSLGGPIMGTPVANDAGLLNAVIMGASELDLGENVVLDGLQDLLGRPFVQDLEMSTADDGDKLDSIRKALSAASIDNAPQIILAAGNSPPELYLQCTAALMHSTYGVTYSDGFIPVASALAFQSDLNGLPQGLKVYPLAPYPTGHVDLESDISIQQDAGNQVGDAFFPPSLTISSSGTCANGLVCNGTPGTQFTIDGSSYAAGNVQEYEQYSDGSVVALSMFSSVGGSVTWQDTPDCSTQPRTAVFSTQDQTTRLFSNAVTEQVVAGNCNAGVTVSVAPTSAQVTVSGTQQFTATVTGTTNTAVTWAVNAINGGNSTIGTISGTGLYNAPAVSPNPPTVTVTATSQADTSVSASASVTITGATTGGVTISPQTVSVPMSGVQTFVATVSGGGSVSWSVQEGATGGTITNTGLYSAPATTGTFHVVATNAANSSQTATATVTVVSASAYALLYVFGTAQGVGGLYPAAALVQGSDGYLYGTTEYGIDDGASVFKVSTSGNFDSIGFIDSISQLWPTSSLLQSSDGSLYGTSEGGGSFTNCIGFLTFPDGCGLVFKVDTSGNISAFHSFSTTDGLFQPDAPLILASDGNFYGTTFAGGTPNCGTNGQGCGGIFKMDTSGNVTMLYAFSGIGSDGAYPTAPLIQASDGYLYGTTSGGGQFGLGTIFRSDTSGNISVLHSFSGSDGEYPFAGLVQATDGSFYGTATQGGNTTSCAADVGALGCGTLFKMDASGSFTLLHDFVGMDGDYPVAGLKQAVDGYFYGTTWAGGDLSCSINYNFQNYPYFYPPGCGTIFRMDTSGNITVLHNFEFEPSDGSGPAAGVLQANDGNLYGTTFYAGGSFGVVYKLSLDGPGNITVSISETPPPPQVVVSGTLQFMATVTGTSNQAVNWSVGSINGGNSTVGAINAQGLYTAPATVPSGGTVTVTATSQAYPGASASETITICPPPCCGVCEQPPASIIRKQKMGTAKRKD